MRLDARRYVMLEHNRRMKYDYHMQEYQKGWDSMKDIVLQQMVKWNAFYLSADNLPWIALHLGWGLNEHRFLLKMSSLQYLQIFETTFLRIEVKVKHG